LTTGTVTGYGIDVMVAYDKACGLIERYKLENFSPIPINNYEMPISSLWWRCGLEYIDNNTVEICFKDESEKIKRRYNRVDSPAGSQPAGASFGLVRLRSPTIAQGKPGGPRIQSRVCGIKMWVNFLIQKA